MEPARGERDDHMVGVNRHDTETAPMGPLVVSGMTDWPHDVETEATRPQWSPLVVSGMTPARRRLIKARAICRNGARSW